MAAAEAMAQEKATTDGAVDLMARMASELKRLGNIATPATHDTPLQAKPPWRLGLNHLVSPSDPRLTAEPPLTSPEILCDTDERQN